ncbi:MAG TPA: hypothetical protein VHW65_11015 [Gemmatimonadales bacterium]|jgi:opacity protein-like surface antigen|nr:hypothetical protein [Gemmatimonadales bacterium]
MRRIVRPLALLALAGVIALPLAAQGGGLVEVNSGSGLRHGFFVTGALGDGMESYQYADVPGYSSAFSNPAFAVRIGGTPSPYFRLGAEFFGWSGSVADSFAFSGSDTETFGAFLLTGQFYPSLRAGFYLKGGLGVAHTATDYDDGSSNGESGFGFTVGAGWDFALSRNISLGPVIDLYQGSFTARDQNGGALPTLDDRVLNIGASITFQSSRWW